MSRSKLLTVGICLLSVVAQCGCTCIGCRYDLRKYPTPVFASTSKPTQHQWNPNPCADGFDSFSVPGWDKKPSAPAQPLPVGPKTAGLQQSSAGHTQLAPTP